MTVGSLFIPARANVQYEAGLVISLLYSPTEAIEHDGRARGLAQTSPDPITRWRRQLATPKGKRSRKKSPRQLTYFREVKGKIVDNVEIDPDVNAITILFQDKTALSFDLEPRLTVFPELSDWKTGNWRGIKRWQAIHSKISMMSWP